jgi:hypothetical protein
MLILVGHGPSDLERQFESEELVLVIDRTECDGRLESVGMAEAEALDLVVTAEARLWTSDGAEGLSYLTNVRCLAHETIRAARLGWTPRASIPKKKEGWYQVRGVVSCRGL